MEFDILRKIVAEVMGADPDELTAETLFVEDLGADSLDICRILMKIEEDFKVVLPRESISSVNSIEDAHNMIKSITPGIKTE